MIVRPASPGTLCLDTVTPCTEADIAAFWAAGYRAAGRYAQNLSAGELARWHAHGFGVFLIGESREPGWQPSAETGHRDAQVLLGAAQKLSIPAGVSLIDDFESPAPGTRPEDAIAHVDAFAENVAASQGLATVYIGTGPILTSAEWFARPNVHRYAKAGSRQRDRLDGVVEPARGYSWVQLLPFNLRVEGSSVPIDAGVLAHDYLGGAIALVYGE